MRIYQSIAKQSLFRNPTDLRQFFSHSSRIFNALAGKMPLQETGHKKYYGRISIVDMGSLSHIICSAARTGRPEEHRYLPDS